MINNEGRKYMPRLVLALLTSVVAIAAGAQENVRPRMVVGIMIDGLDSQYLDMLRNHFGQDGFNRLLRESAIIANADYGTNVDATAATAMLMTGAAPSTNSVTAAEVYNPETRLPVAAMFDAEAIGNYTQQTFSPKNLAVSTLADEVRIAGAGESQVFAIAPNASQAVLLAGHSANCAIWLDQSSGYWASSTYYKTFPSMLTKRSRHNPLPVRIDTLMWTPLKGSEHYPGLPDRVRRAGFSYVFDGDGLNEYSKFRNSPLLNSEVTDIAGDIIAEYMLGADEVTDMINVAYSLKPYRYSSSNENRYELMDSYLRLDQDIATLIRKVENQTGQGNALFFVAATPPSGRSRRDDEKWGIPYGEFSTRKAQSLLNVYMIAKFGNGQWVNAYHNGQFYLNHKLINSLNLDARTVRTEAALFLARMSGVDHAYTSDDIINGRGDSHLEALKRNTYAPTAGDIYVEVDPGWEIVDDIVSSVNEKRVRIVNRLAPATAPVYILAPNVEAGIIDTPVDVRVVAPTVARLLRIRSPNGAFMPALVF